MVLFNARSELEREENFRKTTEKLRNAWEILGKLKKVTEKLRQAGEIIGKLNY